MITPSIFKYLSNYLDVKPFEGKKLITLCLFLGVFIIFPILFIYDILKVLFDIIITFSEKTFKKSGKK